LPITLAFAPLDFNELDRKLDRALERETVESLNEFLDSKRNNVLPLAVAA
jgi:hypothetical protein